MQLLLVVVAAGFLMFAGHALGRSSGYRAGLKANELDAPRKPSRVQTIVLALIGVATLAGAIALQGSEVRVPTPARLEELSERAERAAIRRAEEGSEAGQLESPRPEPPSV